MILLCGLLPPISLAAIQHLCSNILSVNLHKSRSSQPCVSNFVSKLDNLSCLSHMVFLIPSSLVFLMENLSIFNYRSYLHLPMLSSTCYLLLHGSQCYLWNDVSPVWCRLPPCSSLWISWSLIGLDLPHTWHNLFSLNLFTTLTNSICGVSLNW